MVQSLNLFRSFEVLSLAQQIEKVADMLEEQGFQTDIIKSRQGIRNFIYHSPSSSAVFVVIYKPRKNEIYYTIIDREVYERELRGTNRVLNYAIRHDGSYKIVFAEDDTNKSVHRLVMPCDEKEIDHIAVNKCINTKEMLRPVLAVQNSMNRKFYSRVSLDRMQFKIKNCSQNANQRKSLIQAGFKLEGDYFISPIYDSEKELFEAVNKVEKFLLGEYRYNPLVDFSETWFAYAIYKLLGICSMDDVKQFNAGFMRRHHPNIAKYYQL